MSKQRIFDFVRIVGRTPDFLDRRTGTAGEIFYNVQTRTLRVYDGVTSGGTGLAKSDLANVTGSDFLAKATASGAVFSGSYADLTNKPQIPSLGSLTFTGTDIDSDDSSEITVTPSLRLRSDLRVENNLHLDNDLTVSGTLTLAQPLKMLSVTTAERDQLTVANGTVIYNTSTDKFQGLAAGTWVDLH